MASPSKGVYAAGSRDVQAQAHPEIAAGGYAQGDGTVEFYQRVVAVLPEGGTVLDLGAGRGELFHRKEEGLRRFLVRLGNKYSRRIGADVDPAVLSNPGLDEAKVIEAGQPLPFPDESFDLVLCDWVIEHVEAPEPFISEVRRVLKVGGWFCARTPNRWSYFSIGARLFSGAMESKILRKLQPSRQESDVFPKYYRLNTLGDISAALRPSEWLNATYAHNPNPSYHGNSALLLRLLTLFQNLTPRALASVILIFARRTA
ncbi:MAG TPA: class I SAM-dependent methyltransferase [Methylocella sp.]|nr:class I SAM-dependent methyltransferase [Methylocella sp.]